MKKILLIAAVLVGGAAASQAGIDFHIGFSLPFPHPEQVIISRPCPTVVAVPAPVCAPRPVVVAPVCAPAPVCHERVMYSAPARPPYYGRSSHDYGHDGYRGGREYAYGASSNRGWSHDRRDSDRNGWNGGHGGYRR